MADQERSYSDMTPEEVYATFLNALAGLEDDADIKCFSPEVWSIFVPHFRPFEASTSNDIRARLRSAFHHSGRKRSIADIVRARGVLDRKAMLDKERHRFKLAALHDWGF